LKFSYWGAAAGDDNNIVERGHESSSREGFALFIIDAQAQKYVARRMVPRRMQTERTTHDLSRESRAQHEPQHNQKVEFARE